jgi:glycosyltransferase involved in cell wall biosynthesis
MNQNPIEKPHVSILIPTFNQDVSLLRACIESSSAQKFQNLEIIVSDNHSTNEAPSFLASLKDGRIKVVSPPEHLSMKANFHFCASCSSSEYISFLSSDDVLLPGAIQKLVSVLERFPRAAFACGNVLRHETMPTGDFATYLIRRPRGHEPRELEGDEAAGFFFPWRSQSTWMVGNLIRRAAYVQTGGLAQSNLEVASDVWLTRRLLDHGTFVYVDEPLALFRVRPNKHRCVEPDRGVLECMDAVLLHTDTSRIPVLTRFVQFAKLIHALGNDMRTSASVKRSAAEFFSSKGRWGLLACCRLSSYSPRTLRVLALGLSLPRRLWRRLPR